MGVFTQNIADAVVTQDISTENIVWAAEDVSFEGLNIAMGKIFFIDFGSARILPAGPGSGVRIHDIREYGGKWEPSEGFDAVDPYSYDIDSLGVVLGRQFSVRRLRGLMARVFCF